VAALIVSVGFDRRCPEKTTTARRAATDLLRTYVRAGLLPYRLGLGQADLLPQMERPWPRILSEMQRIFDSSGCMAPSRYETLWAENGDRDLSWEISEEELCAR
jgi:hypothetical protein